MATTANGPSLKTSDSGKPSENLKRTKPLTPYFEQDGIAIYHGDCRDVMADLSASVDLIVMDPPYGIGYQSNRGSHEPIVGDCGDFDLPAVIRQSCCLLRRGRHVYIFGPVGDLSETALTARVELIWDKGVVGMGDLSLPWGASHEPITFATYELSAANRAKGYGGLSARLRKGSVVRSQRMQSGQNKRHPTEKPVDVLRQLIESSSLLGETVFDPVMGVGSTLVAAAHEGRRAIGIEIEERHCEEAAKRLSKGALNLFGEATA